MVSGDVDLKLDCPVEGGKSMVVSDEKTLWMMKMKWIEKRNGKRSVE